MNHEKEEAGEYASPPCFAHELSHGQRGYEVSDAQTARDVARWRQAERARLIALRQAIPARDRQRHAERVAGSLDDLLSDRNNAVVSLYWPFRAELNLRHWMQSLVQQGVQVALPVVVAKAQPLEFRQWTPSATMAPGIWNIPVPVDGQALVPTHVCAPLVGYDRHGYRLGYGGGFFDRTLAWMNERQQPATVIGVGYSATRIPTIYPQSHDIPMHLIVTESEVLRIGTG